MMLMPVKDNARLAAERVVMLTRQDAVQQSLAAGHAYCGPEEVEDFIEQVAVLIREGLCVRLSAKNGCMSAITL